MAMIDAELFLKRCAEDDAFRSDAYGTDGPAGFTRWIGGAGYAFTRHELENAVRRMKLESRDEEAAAFVDELGKWYEFMSGGFGNDTDDDAAMNDPLSSGCAPSLCATCGSSRLGSSCHG